jgi:hypothetical protein
MASQRIEVFTFLICNLPSKKARNFCLTKALYLGPIVPA